MTDRRSSTLLEAAVSTFEDLGFVFPETELREWQAEAELTLSASVAFEGRVNGCFVLSVSDCVARELAENMLGTGGEVSESVKQDAVGEIANVICGNVVPLFGAPGDVFDLGAPEVRSVVVADDRPGSDGTSLDLGVGDGRAVLRVMVEARTSGARVR